MDGVGASLQFNFFARYLRDKQGAKQYLLHRLSPYVRQTCDWERLSLQANRFYGEHPPPQTVRHFLYKLYFNKTLTVGDEYDECATVSHQNYLFVLIEIQLQSDDQSTQRLAHYCFNIMSSHYIKTGATYLPIVLPLTTTLSGVSNPALRSDIKQFMAPMLKHFLNVYRKGGRGFL